MYEQKRLSDFGIESAQQAKSHTCMICGRCFDSTKGRGIHRANAHSESEIKNIMLSELRKLSYELGSAPTQNEMTQYGRFSFKLYQKRFGSWNEALDAADMTLNRENRICEAELLNELVRLREELDRTPTSRDMAESGCYSPATYSRKFDSWNTAIQQAGLELGKQHDIPKTELVDELQRFAEKLGRLPTVREMEQEGRYAVNTYAREFGSWNNALAEVFNEVNRQREVDSKDLIDEITRLASMLDRTPTADDMANHGEYGISTVADEFGTWNQGLKAAGYELNEYRETPKSELLEELKRLADELGRPPRASEMERDGRFGWATYRTHFGSWNEALEEVELTPSNIIYPDQLDHIVRSGWELDVASLLRENDIQYEYESLTIEYGEGRSYKPDFITDDYVIEVKGRIYRNERQIAVAAMGSIDERDYVVVGAELPADIHIPWENRERVVELF